LRWLPCDLTPFLSYWQKCYNDLLRTEPEGLRPSRQRLSLIQRVHLRRSAQFACARVANRSDTKREAVSFNKPWHRNTFEAHRSE
jgi:hypothetical protein